MKNSMEGFFGILKLTLSSNAKPNDNKNNNGKKVTTFYYANRIRVHISMGLIPRVKRNEIR